MPTRHQTEFDLSIRLELTGSLVCPPGWKGENHRHAFLEILYITAGDCHLRLGDRAQPLAAGQALLVAPMEDHQLTAGKDGTALTYVGFRCATGEKPLEDFWKEPLTERAGEFRELIGIMGEMADASDFNPYGIRLIRALLPAAEYLKSGSDDGSFSSQKDILCRNTIRYIRANLHRFVTVGEIASSLYVTPHYLGLVFSSLMGRTILQYQQTVKMERAAALIRGGMSLTDISDRLGYSSPQYFSKCFKTYFGFPPNRMKAGTEE